VTAVKIGDNLVLDPTDDEEKALDSRLTVSTMQTGEICALQKGGSSPLTFEDIHAMVELCCAKAKELRALAEGAK